MAAPKSIKAQSEDKNDDTISKSVPTFLIDPRTIVMVEGFNGRPINADHVTTIKAAKRAGSIFPPLIIATGDSGERELVDGHHRLTADLELIAEGVPIEKVLCMEFKGGLVDRKFLMMGSADGLALTALQLAVQYSELVNLCGVSYSKIAERRGRSVQHVKDMLRLLEQPEEIKQMIEEGIVTATTVTKLVQAEGSKVALETLKEAKAAVAAAPAPKARGNKAVTAPPKGITQKVIDNLAKNAVPEAKKRAATASEHISAMLDSDSFDGPTKAHLRDTLALLTGKVHRIAAPDTKANDAKAIGTWLVIQRDHEHTDVRRAAQLMLDVFNGKKMPEDTSYGSQFYSNMVWLQDIASGSKEPMFRAAAHWFLAVMNSKRSGIEIAPAPSVMALEEALRAEMDSNGHALAETLCPEQTDLIQWARGRA